MGYLVGAEVVENKSGHTTFTAPVWPFDIVECVCGWFKKHPRKKVRDAAAARHEQRNSRDDAPDPSVRVVEVTPVPDEPDQEW